MHHAVDLGRVARRAPDTGLIDEYAHRVADFGAELGCADARLRFHEATPPLLLHRLGHRGKARACRRALDRRGREAADAVELRLPQKREQLGEFGFRLAREAGDERRADGDARTELAPATDALQHFFAGCRALHQTEDARGCMLERNVEIRKDLARGHERNHVVHVRVRVEVMQAYTYADLAERRAEIRHACLQWPAAPETRAVLDVDAVGA